MISLVTQADGSARRVPWVAIALVVAMSLIYGGQRGDRGPAQAQADAALAEVVSYFHEKPYVLLPDRMQRIIPVEIAQQLREDYETERAALGIHSGIPDFLLKRAQERFDRLAATAFEKQDVLPANRHGFRDSGDPPQRYFEHAFFHLTLASLAVALAAVLLLGIPLEDVWGSVVFALFCTAMIPLGAVAFGALQTGLLSPWLGASGLAAALLGASTLRWLTAGSPRLLGGLPLPAWLVVPTWFAAEYVLVRGVTFEALPSTPYLAHAAMLGAGFAGALVIRMLGLEEALITRWSDSPDDLHNPTYEKAMTLREKGKPAEALALLQGGFEREPDPDSALGIWDLARDLGEPVRGVDAALWYVRDALKRGNGPVAAKQWLEVAEWAGDVEAEPGFFVRIADALMREDETEAGCDALDRAARSSGRFTGALAVRAVRLASASDCNLARRVAERALAGDALSAPERSDLEALLRALPTVEPESAPAAAAAAEIAPTRAEPGALDDFHGADLDSLDPSMIDPELLAAAVAEAAASEIAAADEVWDAEADPSSLDPASLDPGALDLGSLEGEGEDDDRTHDADPNALDALDPNALHPDALEADALAPDSFGDAAIGESRAADAQEVERWNSPGLVGDLSAELESDRGEAAPGPMASAPEPEPEVRAVRTRPTPPFAPEARDRFELDGLRPLRVIGAVPMALEETAIRLDAEQRGKTRLAYERIEAVSVAAVHGLGAQPVVVVDLVLNWLGGPDEPLQVLRVRSDHFDPRKLAPGASSGVAALRAFVSRIVEECAPTCLPDATAVRGEPFSVYADLGSYQREVLRVEDGGG